MICFVLVAFIVMKLEKLHKSLWAMLYTHTHTHFDRSMQYFQIQSMSLFSLNFLYNILTTLLLTLPKIDSLHFPEFRNMCGTT